MTEPGRLIRHFPCFIESLAEQGIKLGIPAPYARWAGIFMVSVALGRHVWTINAKGKTYPNVYIMMVGPPGTGKTQTEALIVPLMRDIGINLTAQHLTKASLIDEVRDNQISRPFGEEEYATYKYHHAPILTSEFGETFDGKDMPFLSLLNRWWDCPDFFRERKRHLGDPINLQNVCCNILTGVQPVVLANSFPPEAWNGGFLSRTLFVYVPQQKELLLHNIGTIVQETMTQETYSKLLADFENIARIRGPYNIGSEADRSYVKEYLRWKQKDRQEPCPKHPKLRHYISRREHNLEKLSIIAAASRGGRYLAGQDYATARNWLEEIEFNLDEIFLEMAANDDGALMEDMTQWLWKEYWKNNERPIIESKVWKFLSGKIGVQRIQSFMLATEKAGYIKIHYLSGIKKIEPLVDVDLQNL